MNSLFSNHEHTDSVAANMNVGLNVIFETLDVHFEKDIQLFTQRNIIICMYLNALEILPLTFYCYRLIQ